MLYDLDPNAVLATLSADPELPYARIEHRARVDSTNTRMRAEAAPWLVISADEQTAGRGRLDRSWSTTPGTALAVSVCVPPVPDPGWMPLATGVAVHRALARAAGLETILKWPNDVLVPSQDERKIAGILCEATDQGIIVGVGLNVHHDTADLPVPTATSVRIATGRTIERATLLAAYLRELAVIHRQLSVDQPAVRAAYLRVCGTIGRRVRLEQAHGSATVQITGVDPQGCLQGTDALGRAIFVAAGDVVHLRPAMED